MFLVSHKMTFHKNEAAYLCVTMRKRSGGIVGTIWHVKFWHRYQDVRNKFLWCQFQVSLSRKRGAVPVKFLDKISCTLYCLSNDRNVIWHCLRLPRIVWDFRELCKISENCLRLPRTMSDSENTTRKTMEENSGPSGPSYKCK